MSLILEALRKSEAERRRGQVPDVALELPPTPASRPRTLAAWLLPALVGAVLLVLVGWWIQREPAKIASSEAAIEATQTPPTPADPAPALMPRIEPSPAARAMTSVQAAGIAAPVATPPPKPATVSTAATPSPDIAAARAAQNQPMAQTMPTAQVPARPLQPPASAISNDTSMLPPIKLSMLIWDEVPSRRFVILNGQRMVEGDHYGGITVVGIERNGVVVESNGNSVRVPLP